VTSDLHIVDLFAGAGGISTGIANALESLGRTPGTDAHLVAINHDEDAITTHERNHPWADHYRAKVEAIHPPDVAPPGDVDLLTAGPSCTHFSTARGGQPVKEQERASPWHVLRWVELLRPKHLLIENVGDLRSWGPVEDGEPTRDGSIYQRWIGMLHALGYTVIQDDRDRYGVKLRAADYGDATTRERLFVIASRTKRPTAPAPTHSDADDDLPDWTPASEIIDWSDRGESLFARSRPLSGKTLDRIAVGIRDYCDDRLAPYADALERLDKEGVAALQEDIVDAGDLPDAADDRDEPFLVRAETVAADGGQSTPMVMGQHSGALPRDADEEPVPTIAKAGAIHYIDAQGLVLPRNGSNGGKYSNTPYDPSEQPLHVVTAKNHDGRLVTPFLVQYNGEPKYSVSGVDGPLPTLSTRARYALCDPAVYPFGIDLRYRMLDPPETKQAQGFPADYELAGSTKKSRRAQIGNAVPVGMATALAEHILTTETATLSTFGAGFPDGEGVDVPPYEQAVEAARDD